MFQAGGKTDRVFPSPWVAPKSQYSSSKQIWLWGWWKGWSTAHHGKRHNRSLTWCLELLGSESGILKLSGFSDIVGFKIRHLIHKSQDFKLYTILLSLSAWFVWLTCYTLYHVRSFIPSNSQKALKGLNQTSYEIILYED